MNYKDIDRATLKSIIKEILKEDINIFKDIIKELLIENQVIASKEQAERRARLEQMINEDFDKYDEVFQSLAK